MTETQKRINAYRKALPHMKERVTAVALLLVIAITMMTSATFAWMTLSRSPEASSIFTTVSTNGNLEIALSGPEGKQPANTQVGDGNREDIMRTNLTWGNLINLSNKNYGLDALTLRPASLNSSNLVESPLYAVEYGEDGRVLGYFTDFSFSNYNTTLGTFGVPSTGIEYGVRAVSSVTYEDAAGETFFKNQMKSIRENQASAKNIFNSIVGNTSYMKAISGLVGVHVSSKLDSANDISCVQYIDSLVAMITDFQASVDAVGQTMVDIANLHLYINEYRQTPELYEKNKYTLEDLKENKYSNPFVTKYRPIIDGLADYITLAKKADSAYAGIKAAKNIHTSTGNVYWKANLQTHANTLCNMTTATLDGMTVSSMTENIGSAIGILTDGKLHQAKIVDGALKDLDQMLGAPTMVAKNLPIDIAVPNSYNGIPIPFYGGTTQTIRVDVTTAASASTEFVLPEDVKEAEQTITDAAGSDYKGQAVAADTYAMAIDFWVRTNEANPLLILEGEYEYREEIVPVYGTDASGLEVALYTFVDANNTSHDVYKVEDTDGEGNQIVTWYFEKDHSVLTEQMLAGVLPTPQTEVKKIVTGYGGVNRVWSELDDPDNEYAEQIMQQNGISTTQGSGSCYIFYPESPEDQERCKRLLASMRVAFADEAGNLLGEAAMETENIIENAGRIVVPLQMRPQPAIVIGQDEGGNDIVCTNYITPMIQNKATRITAIVYLDGSNLSNSDVLAAGSINGQLNIQFGTSELEMKPMDNVDLMKDYYRLEWHNSEEDNKYYFDHYSEDTCRIDLRLLMEGSQPASIKGNFISYISATQGARECVFEMMLGQDGFWEAYVYDEEMDTYVKGVPFSGPGNYELRSLQIDGVDILLDECVYVEIDGIKINSLTCQGWNDPAEESVMTAQNIYPQKMTMSLSTSGGLPEVHAVFLGDNGKTVTAKFTKVGETYEATANFTASGTYKMTYMIVDGVYTPLDEELYKTLAIRLGLRANIVITQPVNQEYRDLEVLLASAATEDEQKQIKNEMAAVLQLLHYGNGIPGDENENGLQLQQMNGNWSIVHDGGETLFMDVSCIITDDQGNEMKNLGNLEIFYTAGAEATRLKDGLQWNAQENRYEGTFLLNRNFGLYRFEQITIGGETSANKITAAKSAPTITSIAPTPMTPVVLAPYEDLIQNLSPNYKREMYITLQDAPAAILQVTLTKGEGETATTVTKTISSYASEQPFGDSTRYTFAIPIDSDGQWTLTEVKVCNVFYGGIFYAGGESVEGWLNLDLNGNKKLDELVEGGETDTYYLTEVVLHANRVPSSSSNEFMMGNACNDMYITVTNQNRPLVDVLTEIAANEKFKDYHVPTDVTVSMSYTYTGKKTNWTVDNESKLPTRNFGGALTMNTATGRYEVGAMNFLVDGIYDADFKLTIGTITFNTPQEAAAAGLALTGAANALETDVEITWQKPVVKITEVTGATKDSMNNSKFVVNLATDSDRSNNPLEGVQNYFEDYYANVHIAGEYGSYSCPTVTMKMFSGAGACTNSSFVINNNESSSQNRTYSFSGNEATSSNEIGNEDSTWLVLTTIYTRDQAGKTVVEKINMAYNDTTFHLELSNPITVNQQHEVKRVTLTVDATKVDMPAKIAVENATKKTFDFETGGKASVMIISPDGRDFYITTPTPTRVVTRQKKNLTASNYSNETAVDEYVSVENGTITQGSGCNATEVTAYTVYQKWQRDATEIGTMDTYTDTYKVEAWTNNAASGAKVTVTGSQSYTANDPVLTSSVKTGSTNLTGNTVTEIKYELVTEKTATSRGEIKDNAWINQYLDGYVRE